MRVGSRKELMETLSRGGCPLVLVLGKDGEEEGRCIEAVCQMPGWTHRVWDAAVEGIGGALEELNTRSLFVHKRVVVARHCEALKEAALQQLCRYCQQTEPHVLLCLTMTALAASHPLYKVVQEKGVVYPIVEEKAWDKERRLIEQLVDHAQQRGQHLDYAAAQLLVQGMPEGLLFTELDKVLCYALDRPQVTVACVQAVCTLHKPEVLWQLADAALQKQTQRTLYLARQLASEGFVPLVQSAALKNQIQSAALLLDMVDTQGKEAAQKKFPQWKGGLFDKKLATARSYGAEPLQWALEAIFEAELKMRNTGSDAMNYLEILLVRLTSHDTIPITQCSRIYT